MSFEREPSGVIARYSNGRRRYDPKWQGELVSLCLAPGASVSRLARDHGVNTNLVWKWIQQHRQAQEKRQPSASSFIPVHIAPSGAEQMLVHEDTRTLDLQPDSPGRTLSEPDRSIVLSAPAKLNVSLPNGVKLCVECSDVRAMTAIIGAVRDV